MASGARRPRLMSTDRFRAGYRGTLKKILTTPVVLEAEACGAYVKAGFAGENAPRAVFPVPWRPAVPSDAPLEAWLDALRPFVRRLFFEELLVHPRERKVVLLENPSAPWAFKEAMVKALFALGVPHVLFLPAQQMPPYCAGPDSQSGLVVDVGYAATRVLPLLDGVQAEGAAAEVPLGVRDVQARFVRLVRAGDEDDDAKLAEEEEEEKGEEKETGDARLELPGLDELGVRDLVARLCFVRPLPRESVLPDERVAEEQARNPHLPPHVWEPPALRPQPAPEGLEVRLNAAGQTLAVPGRARSHAADALFDTSAASPTETSLGEAVLDALLACPPDARAAVASGLLVVGGGAAIPGLASRLADEIDNCLVRPRYAPLRAFRRGMAVRGCAFPPATAAWVGGSIVASFALPERLFLAKGDYDSGKAVVADWARARVRLSPLMDEQESY